MHMLKLQDGEVPVALENLYGEFNPFEYFPTNQNGEKDGGVYRQGLAPTREGFQSGILLGCEVLGLLGSDTRTYQSCGNPLCEGVVEFGEHKACPLCLGRYHNICIDRMINLLMLI